MDHNSSPQLPARLTRLPRTPSGLPILEAEADRDGVEGHAALAAAVMRAGSAHHAHR